MVVDIFPGPPGGAPRPVVAFTTPEGERIRFTSTARTGWRAPAVGDAVPVVYPIGLQPRPVSIRSARWTPDGRGGGAGLLLMALGGYVAWYARRRCAGHRSAVNERTYLMTLSGGTGWRWASS